MNIKLLIRRAAGSTVELGGVTYAFSDANDHTCEVENEDHARHLLALKPCVFVAVDQVIEDEIEDEESEGDDQPPVGQDPADVQAKALRKPRVKKAAKE